MSKPKVRTKKFLDWVELKPYLEKNGIKTEKVLSLLAEYDGLHNGCDIPIELGKNLYEPPIQKMSDFLAKEFPDAIEDGSITLHVWW